MLFKLTRLALPLLCLILTCWTNTCRSQSPFEKHGPLRVADSGTYLVHRDGTPFFFLADTVWTGPAFSTLEDWNTYLDDRKAKGFTAIQFNMVSPWRVAKTDAEGRAAYVIENGQLKINQAYYAERLDARMKAIADKGLLAVPVLCWANRNGDAGVDLTTEQIIQLVDYELGRYEKQDALWILGGDNRYDGENGERWKTIGRKVFANRPNLLTTTHPTVRTGLGKAGKMKAG